MANSRQEEAETLKHSVLMLPLITARVTPRVISHLLEAADDHCRGLD